MTYLSFGLSCWYIAAEYTYLNGPSILYRVLVILPSDASWQFKYRLGVDDAKVSKWNIVLVVWSYTAAPTNFTLPAVVYEYFSKHKGINKSH